MNWSDERYVRVYTRDTISWFSIGWEAQALFLLILRKVDRAGVLDMGIGPLGVDVGTDAIADGCEGLGGLLRMPAEVVRRALARLLADGCIVHEGQYLVVKNFIEAQESTMSTVTRQRESRERRRDQVRAGLDPKIKRASSLVYFLQSEDGGPIKIGATNDVAKRMFELQTARADKLVLLTAVPGDMMLERSLHLHFAAARVKGEWFTPVPELVRLINDATESGVIGDLSRVPAGPEPRDASQFVTCHSVPSRTVPSRTVPDPEETLVGLAPAVLIAAGSTSPIAEPPRTTVSPQDLERIYQAYPRKDGKAAGMRKAKTQIRSQDRLCQLERAVENYTRKVELEATSPQYVKHFSTFMNCWEDYLDPSVAQPVRYMDPSNMKAGDSLRLAAAAEERERDDRFGVPAKLRLSSGGLPDGEDQPGDHGRLPAEAHPLRARRTDGRAEPAHGQGNLLADNRAGPRRA